MAHEIQYSDEATAELNAILDNYWLVSRAAAATFAELHDRCIASLGEFPSLGRRESGEHFSLPIGKTGFRILYEFAGGVVIVLGYENVRRRRP